MAHIELTIQRRHLFIIAGLLAAAVVLIPTISRASHTFDDVDDGNVFHSDIDWLAANGVTRGCNPPLNTKFCPGSNVTREQMAAFMHRLAENRVVDAGTVEGMTASQLKGQTGDTGPAGPAGPGGTRVLAGTVSEDGSVATGDITGVTDNGTSYTVRFSGQNLTECTAIASAGSNDAVGGADVNVALFSVAVTPGAATDLVVVTLKTPEGSSSNGSSFHIVVVCP